MTAMLKVHRTSMSLWGLIMWLLRKLAPEAPATQYFAEEVERVQPQLLAVEEAVEKAKMQLTPEDRLMLLAADAPITQARAARRRFWKHMKAEPFAALYKAQKLTLEQAEKTMVNDEKMPGYFRKRVLSLLGS